MEYEFTLRYQLAEEDSEHDEIVERLGEHGCDDALVGVGLPCRVALSFTREASSAKAALLGAMADVRKALPSARLIEAGPDFVGLSDAAELVRMSRQNLRKLMLSYPAEFPAPVHDGSTGVWHLSELLDWLRGKGSYILPQGVVEAARAARQVNAARQALVLSAREQKELSALLA